MINIELNKFNKEDLINAYVFVLEEIKKREIEAGETPYSWLFPIIKKIDAEKKKLDIIESIEKDNKDNVKNELLVKDEEIKQKNTNPYMVKQEGIKTNKFVIQKHSRGIWSEKDINDIKTNLKKIKRLPDDEANKALRKLWSNYKIAILKNDLGKLKASAQKASDTGGKVSEVISKFISKKPPKKNELAGLMNVLINRGNAHLDLRILLSDKKLLIDWALNTPGAIIQFLKDGRVEDILKNKFFDDESNISAQKRPLHNLKWLHLVSSKKPTYFAEVGQAGATEETAGRIDYVDSGLAIYGVQKTDYHEYFLFFKKNKGLNGRYNISLISGEDYEKVPDEWWKINKPIKTQEPYITTHDQQKEKEKAKKEKINIIWNPDTLKALKAIGYKDLPEEVKKQLPDDTKEHFNRFVPIYKAKEDEQLVTGVVLEPETIDGQGEIISAEEIRKTCFKFMQDFATLGLMHSMFPSSLKILENYIAPVNFKIDGYKIKKNSWLITTKVLDKEIWKAIKSGEITGYSVQGISRVKEEEVEVEDG